MITNEFETGFGDNLDAIFGSSASFIETASITLSQFIYSLDEFKGEFEKDLEVLLGSVFKGVTSILPVKYGEVQEVEELEGVVLIQQLEINACFQDKILKRWSV